MHYLSVNVSTLYKHDFNFVYKFQAFFYTKRLFCPTNAVKPGRHVILMAKVCFFIHG